MFKARPTLLTQLIIGVPILALMVIAAALAGGSPVKATPMLETVVRCEPETVVADIGEELSFLIYVENVVDLYAADVQMSFDPAIAQVVDADPAKGGTQIEILDDLLFPDFVVRDWADNVAGTIWYANTHVNPRGPVSGSGALARVTMTSLQAGGFIVPITSQELAMSNGVTIPSTARNCRVTFFDPNTVKKTFLPVSLAP